MQLRKVAIIGGAVGVVLAGVFGHALYRDIAHSDCGLAESDARARVIRELDRRKWPVAGLGPAVAAGTCSYEYDYRSGDTHFSFSVLSTWGHGVKIGWYDHAQDPPPQP